MAFGSSQEQSPNHSPISALTLEIWDSSMDADCAEEGSHLSATSGRPHRRMYDTNQPHAAVVELVALDNAGDNTHGAELVRRR